MGFDRHFARPTGSRHGVQIAGRQVDWKHVNNRSEEALGSAKDLWTAYREGRFGEGAPTPFLGYLFLLEDRSNVKQPVTNKEPYFKVDPAFRGLPAPSKKAGTMNYQGVTYAERYELLCRRLVLERIYNASCFMMATNAKPTVISQPAQDLTFARFAAALRGHAATFVGSQLP